MSETEKPKIIVDEDWKSQVEKEREELRQTEQENANSGEGEGDDLGPIPPASLPVLIATLGAQAMSMMGLMPGPDGKIDPNQINMPVAKHMIDMIAMLEEKTKGNITEEESGMLNDNLHQLRMAYVAVNQELNSGSASPAGAESAPPSSIELP